jgi:diaminohydroxyphosphoribosylaminopyrimidine deaminase/5-amino-6-(5-phosphoribosylamino)uracil reductase
MDAEALMREAIAEARAALGHTHPNPAVGAVLVHAGAIVARGHTAPAGGPHAEVAALRAFAATGLRPTAATTLVVTLEPCSTHGRTPPCTEAIRAAGIRRVIVGATDPNPRHAGRGFALLRAAGIEVTAGVLAGDCTDLNLIFNHWIRTGRPLLAGKIATTLDGRIATRTGAAKWITGAAARADVMRWRRYFPAIAVGAGTVLADNPRLTARAEDAPEWCPLRFIFDRRLATLAGDPPQVYGDAHRARTILVAPVARGAEAAEAAERLGIGCWPVAERDADGGLADFTTRCAREGITGVLIEGGARLLSALLEQQRLDYLLCYRAPLLFADSAALAPFAGLAPATPAAAIRLTDTRHAVFAEDQLLRGRVTYS